MVIIGLLIAANSWAVIVTGSGRTKEEAINNGLREAVEMFTSTFVYGVTDVENYQIQKDQIVAASSGYVKSYRIIKTSNMDDLIMITMDVKLSEDKIEGILRDNIKLMTVEDVLKDYNNVTQRQDQIRKFAEMLKILAKRPIHEKYGVIYDGYEIKRISATQVDIVLNVRVVQNPFYHRTYNEILKNLSESDNSGNTWLVGGNFRIESKRLVNSKYYISRDSNRVWEVDDIHAQIQANGTYVDKCRDYRDNLLVTFSPTKFITGFIKLFPGEFVKGMKGDETPIDDKHNNFAIKGSKIIPPEGIPMKIKYVIKNSEDIKGLKDLKLTMGNCGENKPSADEISAMKKKKKARKQQGEKTENERGGEYRNKNGALVIDR